MSRIVVFGKIPPIQGGVSARTLEFIRALRDDGEHVTVVTNAASAEASYRSHFLDQDGEKLQEYLSGVTLHDPSDEGTTFHLPFSEAWETRILGAGLEACRSADLVVGWYFQPYGVAAAIAGRLLKKPCVLMHAGSDIGRLARRASFSEAYREVFRDASIISTSLHSKPLLEGMFDIGQIINASRGYRLPRYFNTPRGDRRDFFQELRHRALTFIPQWGLTRQAEDVLLRPWRAASEVALLELGTYGKLGEQKGHFDLLDAVERSQLEGLRLTMVVGGGLEALEVLSRRLERSPTLSRCVRVAPLIPAWKVPHFIDSLDCVAFLERNFEIGIHTPQVPTEIMWRGAPLLCSDEIIQKQPYRTALLAWQTHIPAGDPRDVDNLAHTLRHLMERRNLRDVGRAGSGIVRAFFAGPAPSDNFVQTLREHQLLPHRR